jgi:hypothetical protein
MLRVVKNNSRVIYFSYLSTPMVNIIYITALIIIIGALHLIIKKLKKMAVDLTALQAAVATEGTAIDSLVALANSIPSLLAQIPTTDPETQAAIDAVTATVQAKTTEITTALAADTPVAEPAPTDAPQA